jgi:OOP family OmpA-OmpF porin
VTPEAGQPINLQGCKAGDKIILHGVNFDFNKATLTVNAKAILDQVAGELKKYTAIDVELGGYTDGRGSVAYNLRLSDRRAASVKAYLVGAGVDAARMTSVGYGKADPVADNNTDEGRELNRRVELKITGGVASSSTTSTDAGTTTTAITPPDAPGDSAPADAAPADAAPPAAPADAAPPADAAAPAAGTP